MKARPLVLILALALPGCAAIEEFFVDPSDVVVMTVRPDSLYEEVVSHYIELCAVSQYRPLDKPLGGIPGHAVMYLKGACIDEAAGYPRLRKCKRNEWDRRSPEHGAGVSVNKWFKNVNWVGTPGKQLFFDGDLGTYDTLDQDHFDAAVDRAIGLDTYRGVEIHPIPGHEEMTTEEFIAHDSIGTDFALRFGRSVFCARVPMHPAMLYRTMDFLNELNDKYQSGVEYNWSGYADNCVHTLHNAIAAAGIWKPKTVRAIRMRQVFNMAVPANTFVELAFLSNEFPVEDFNQIRGDELHWENLLEHDFLPAGPGALVKSMAVHQENQLYDTRFRLFILEGWFSAYVQNRSHELLSDGRFTSIDANVHFWQQRYRRILEERPEPDDLQGRLRGQGFRADRESYYDYIEESQDALNRVMGRLAELDRERTRLLDRASPRR